MNNNFNQIAFDINNQKNSYLNRQQDKLDAEKERQDLLTEGITLPFLESSTSNILQKGLKKTLTKAGFNKDDIEDIKSIGKKIKGRDFSGAFDDIQKNNKVKKFFKTDYLDKLKGKTQTKISDIKKEGQRLVSKAQEVDPFSGQEIIKKKDEIKLPDNYNEDDDDIVKLKNKLDELDPDSAEYKQANRVYKGLVLSSKEDMARTEAEQRISAFKGKGIGSWEDSNFFKGYKKVQIQEQPINLKQPGEKGFVRQEIEAREKPQPKISNEIVEEDSKTPQIQPKIQGVINDFEEQKQTIKTARKSIVKKVNKLSDNQVSHFNEKYNKLKQPKLDPTVDQQAYIDREVENINSANQAYLQAKKQPVESETNNNNETINTETQKIKPTISMDDDEVENISKDITKISSDEVEADPESLVGDLVFGGAALAGLLGGMFSHNDDKIKAPILPNPTFQAGVDQA